MRKATKMNVQDTEIDIYGNLQEFYEDHIYSKDSDLSIKQLLCNSKSKYKFMVDLYKNRKNTVKSKIKNIDMLINSNFFASKL